MGFPTSTGGAREFSCVCSARISLIPAARAQGRSGRASPPSGSLPAPREVRVKHLNPNTARADRSEGWDCRESPLRALQGMGGRRAAGADGPWRMCTRGGENDWKDKNQKPLAPLWKGEKWVPARDEIAHNIWPFLKQQQWLCFITSLLHYIKYSKFPQAFVRTENPVQLYFPEECSRNSAVASWKKTSINWEALRYSFLLEIGIRNKYSTLYNALIPSYHFD